MRAGTPPPNAVGTLDVWAGPVTGTPNAGVVLADGGTREHGDGRRLTFAVRGDPGFGVSLDATRREAVKPGSGP